MEYYTYAYLRKDGTPYYIGKGKGDRINSSLHRVNLPTKKERVLYLKKNLTEEEAHKHEIYMIAIFGRKDLGTGILRNMTNGGEGNSGRIVSEDTKKKISKSLMGKQLSKKHRESISKTMTGRKATIQHKENMRKGMSGLLVGERNGSYGKKWWNDGINTKFSIVCPGENYVLGRIYRRINKS